MSWIQVWVEGPEYCYGVVGIPARWKLNHSINPNGAPRSITVPEKCDYRFRVMNQNPHETVRPDYWLDTTNWFSDTEKAKYELIKDNPPPKTKVNIAIMRTPAYLDIVAQIKCYRQAISPKKHQNNECLTYGLFISLTKRQMILDGVNPV